MIPTTNGMRPVNPSLLKAVLAVTPALGDVFRLGKLADIHSLRIYGLQHIVTILRNGMIVTAAALLPMTLFLATFRPDDIALGA
jgi:hypothetical protein